MCLWLLWFSLLLFLFILFFARHVRILRFLRGDCVWWRREMEKRDWYCFLVYEVLKNFHMRVISSVARSSDIRDILNDLAVLLQDKAFLWCREGRISVAKFEDKDIDVIGYSVSILYGLFAYKVFVFAEKDGRYTAFINTSFVSQNAKMWLYMILRRCLENIKRRGDKIPEFLLRLYRDVAPKHLKHKYDVVVENAEEE